MNAEQNMLKRIEDTIVSMHIEQFELEGEDLHTAGYCSALEDVAMKLETILEPYEFEKARE